MSKPHNVHDIKCDFNALETRIVSAVPPPALQELLVTTGRQMGKATQFMSAVDWLFTREKTRDDFATDEEWNDYVVRKAL